MLLFFRIIYHIIFLIFGEYIVCIFTTYIFLHINVKNIPLQHLIETIVVYRQSSFKETQYPLLFEGKGGQEL